MLLLFLTLEEAIMKRVLIWMILPGLLCGGCGGDEARVCQSGQTQACSCADGRKGFAPCRADGAGYDACDCASCAPQAGKQCADQAWSWVDGCGNPDLEPAGSCVCPCHADGSDCGAWTDPLEGILGPECVDRSDCLKKIVWDCEQKDGQWVWGTGYFTDCAEEVRCYFRAYTQIEFGGALHLLSDCVVPTEMAPTTIGFSSYRAQATLEACRQDQQATPGPTILSERWVCVAATAPASCLPLQQSGGDLCAAIAAQCAAP
jgi:hypothetical protein